MGSIVGRELVSALRAEPWGDALLGLARTGTESRLDPGEAVASREDRREWWEQLGAALLANRLMPLAAWHLRRYQRSVAVPLMQRLAAAERAHLARNLRLHAALISASRRLGRAGIPVIPLKGTALAARFYPHLGLRPCGDVDILLPQDAAGPGERALAAGGFGRARARSPSGHYNRVLTAGSGPATVVLELHWGIKPAGTATLDAGGLWERARRIEREGTAWWEMAPEDELLYLAVHLSRHRFFPLLLFTDIDALVRCRSIDWRQLWQRARAARLGGVLALVLSVLAAGWKTRVALAPDVGAVRRARWLAVLVRHRGGLGASRSPWGGTPFHVAFELVAEEPLRGQASLVRHAVWPEGSGWLARLARIGRGVLAVARGSQAA